MSVMRIVLGIFLLVGVAIGQTPAAKGLPPRPSPTDYQVVAKAGAYTIAAEFAGHGVPTSNGVFSTEEFVVVEVAVFGPPDSKLMLSYQDFSLRINGKKAAAAQPFEMAFHSLKDPEWAPPAAAEGKSKTGINSGGGGGSEPAPAPVKMPLNLTLAMEQKVRAASLPEGERKLPGAGLVFFQHGGKLSGMKSVELVYSGAAGKASLPLQ